MELQQHNEHREFVTKRKNEYHDKVTTAGLSLELENDLRDKIEVPTTTSNVCLCTTSNHVARVMDDDWVILEGLVKWRGRW